MIKFDKNVASMWFHKIGFWFLVVFLLGFLAGGTFSKQVVDYKLKDSVKLGGVVIDQKVYDIKMRP